MLTRNVKSRQALKEYLITQNKGELLTCYLDLEEIRELTDEQALTRASALVWRYKTQFEAVRHQDHNPNRPKSVEIVLWECLGRLRYVEGGTMDHVQLNRMITNAQNDLLAKLMIPFEGFLHSKQYKTWQDVQIEEDKGRQGPRPTGPASVMANSISSRSETFSGSFSNVLIVDDSLVTLKLTRLTLEKDGHTVDKAMDGQIALDKLKQHVYDVVLIDCNMPVMDGFETIRLFREYENNQNQQAKYTPKRQTRRSDADAGKEEDGNVSDLSDDEALTSAEVSSSFMPSIVATTSAATPHSCSTVGDNQPRMSQLIIGMSTNVDDETRRRALEAGMDFFLPKPFTLQKFTEIIKISMQKKHQSGRFRGSRQRLDKSDRENSTLEFKTNGAFAP